MTAPRWKPPYLLAAAAVTVLLTLVQPRVDGADPASSKKHKASSPSPSPSPAADVSPTPAATPALPPLDKAAMAAAQTSDSMTIPTPGELFAALDKQCKPNWIGLGRGPINTAYTDRSQTALNLGGLIADGYIAVEAQDGQQVKNLGRDILTLAKNLGISKEILGRGKSIQDLVDENDWNSLREELESTQNDVKQAMDSLHDEELVTLVSIGAWVRGSQVVSDVILRNYSQQTSCILRQPELVAFLRAKLDKLSPKTKDTPLIKTVDTGLGEIAKTVSFPYGATPTKAEVQQLNSETTDLVNVIARKD
jgi:hypothetical protein